MQNKLVLANRFLEEGIFRRIGRIFGEVGQTITGIAASSSKSAQFWAPGPSTLGSTIRGDVWGPKCVANVFASPFCSSFAVWDLTWNVIPLTYVCVICLTMANLARPGITFFQFYLETHTLHKYRYLCFCFVHAIAPGPLGTFFNIIFVSRGWFVNPRTTYFRTSRR